MADLSDVTAALAQAVANAIYPGGPGSISAAGLDCHIYPGWPNATDLAATLKAGNADVTVYSGQNLERVTTRYARDWFEMTTTIPTITATVTGYTITIGGTVTPGHYVTLIVDNVAYSYAAQAGTTLASAAAALAALMTSIGATSAGPVIILPANYQGLIVARTGAPGTVAQEVARTERAMMVSIWAPSPQARATIASLLTPALCSTDFMTMPDTSGARITYRQSNDSDGRENAMAYRRDINLWVEYAILNIRPGYPVTAIPVTITGVNSVGDPGTPVTVTA